MTSGEIIEYLGCSEKALLRCFPYQVASETSDLAGVLLYDLHRRISRRKKPLMRDGMDWTYDAMRVLVEAHPYAAESGIRKALLSLEDNGLLYIEKSGVYNGRRYDKKWWYHVTGEGKGKAARHLMRFHPGVAKALGITKAVLLEHLRFKLHEEGAAEYITIAPTKLGVPYDAKTIRRHLNGLVDMGILERNVEDGMQYRPSPATIQTPAKQQDRPLTVNLLPELGNGNIGLLVGNSGAGKTSFACFTAVQMAAEGKKVIYLSLEEPIENINHRMLAGEYGVEYTKLHYGNEDAVARLKEAMKGNSDRSPALRNNLKVIDARKEIVTAKFLAHLIEKETRNGFVPDVVFIDQLEYITETGRKGEPIPAAISIRETFKNKPFETWVVHQAVGAHQRRFNISQIAGADKVTDNFACVIGIGRSKKDAPVIELFSMTAKVKFAKNLDANFSQMRFQPRNW